MKKKDRVFICLFLLISLTISLHDQSLAQTTKLFRIGTGGKTGVYYPIGKLIAKGLTETPGDNQHLLNKKGMHGYIGVAQTSAGSGENLKTIINRETEAGLVQADVASSAYTASGSFKGDVRFRKIRAIASLYPEYFQLVVRKDAGIKKFYDLKGKHISLDEQGSGTLEVMRILLKAYGIAEKDLLPVYLKPVYTHEKLISNELQGFAMMAGAPMEAVLSLQKIGLTLVPIEKEIAKTINTEYPYLVPGKIEGNIYPQIGATETLQVYALLVVSSEMDEDLVYQVTSAIWSRYTLDQLHKGHPQGKAISLKTALVGLSIPLHKGAERFYKEQGLIQRGGK